MIRGNCIPHRNNTMKAFMLKITFIHLCFTLPPLFHLVLEAPTRVLGSAHHLGNETDHTALLAFKNQLVDNPTGVLSSWNNSLHHCSWDGVTCSRKHNRVISLDLNSRSLGGTISPYIGNLSFLKYVKLNRNSLVGQIPPELGRLFRLKALVLSNNTLDGKIPANLSACINLQQFSIGFNKLDGEIAALGLKASSKLKLLGVQENSFRGPLFEVIGNLTSLELINAYDNAFTGTLPSNVGKMRNLTVLDVAGNELYGPIPLSILNCSMLELLVVFGNKLYGEIPPDIGLGLPHLDTLDLYDNRFYGEFPQSVVNLTSIVYISLGSNNLVGTVPRNFGHRLHQLWRLDFGSNNLKGDINFIGSLLNCSKLDSIDLDENEFTGTLRQSIGNLSTSLQFFSIQSNRITGGIPESVTNLINLQAIAFSRNSFTGSILSGLGKLRKLGKLYLYHNRLTGSIPDNLRNLSDLTELYLNDNQLEGSVPQSLGSCKSLLRLDLSSNNLNGKLVEDIFKGPAMFISINLSNNLLEGSIPLEISKQINLVEFYVYQNKLSGTIPSGLGNCFALQTLDIHGNFLRGNVPSSFSSLGSLQTVDFSLNNLSGIVPNYFSKFPLILLNLSYNNFEGEVPTKGVFENVSAIVLDGNNKLCGGIPELNLSRCMQGKERMTNRKMSPALKLIILIICASVGVLLIATWVCLTCRKKKRVAISSASGTMRKSFMKVSYDMLLKATNGFSVENQIGVGSFGSVFKGSLDGISVAIKVLNLQTRGASKSFIAECKALQNVRHRNLLGIITACSSIDFQGNDFKPLVYEFMPNGSLDKWLHGDDNENLTLLQRLDIAIDVAHSLDYLHNDCEVPVVHCDLKPNNILLDSDMVAQVGDFGLAKFLCLPQHLNQSSSLGILGTVGYVAPEYGVGSESSTDGDVYSYGILVLELMTRKRPTDSMFHEGYNLHLYANAALPDNVLQIVDPTLEDVEISEENIDKRRVECMISMISVGIECSKHLPQDRMKISDAIIQLQDARDNLCDATYA